MLNIYGIKNCDSVRKAIKYLKKEKIPYEFIDLKKNSVDTETIKKWLIFTNIENLFNTRGTTYRTLKLKELHLNDLQKEEWLAKENMLIKRPVIIFDNHVIVGYNESIYLEKLPKK